MSVSKIFKVLMLASIMAVLFSPLVSKAADLDALVGAETTATDATVSPVEGTTTTSRSGSDALADAIRNTSTITDESMAKASKFSAPILNFMNIISSTILILTIGAIGVMTILDLAFIAIPPLRSIMYPAYNQSVSGTAPAGGMMTPMGGGFGGYGNRFGYGGMAGGAMGAQAQPQSIRRQWISDEAVKAIGLAVPQPAPQAQPMGMMGGAFQQQQPQQPTGVKSAIVEYLKHRSVFIVVFVVAAMLLTSSLLTGFGLKIFSFINEALLKFI